MHLSTQPQYTFLSPWTLDGSLLTWMIISTHTHTHTVGGWGWSVLASYWGKAIFVYFYLPLCHPLCLSTTYPHGCEGEIERGRIRWKLQIGFRLYACVMCVCVCVFLTPAWRFQSINLSLSRPPISVSPGPPFMPVVLGRPPAVVFHCYKFRIFLPQSYHRPGLFQ